MLVAEGQRLLHKIDMLAAGSPTHILCILSYGLANLTTRRRTSFNAIAVTWLATSPALLLDRAQTIKLNNSSTLNGFIIIPPGLATTNTSTQVAAWTGTAVTLLDGKSDGAVVNNTILGYSYAVQQPTAVSALQRTKILNNNIDCKSGIFINSASDIVWIECNHGYPFASLGAPIEADGDAARLRLAAHQRQLLHLLQTT